MKEAKRLHVSNIPFRFRDPDLRQMFGVRFFFWIFDLFYFRNMEQYAMLRSFSMNEDPRGLDLSLSRIRTRQNWLNVS